MFQLQTLSFEGLLDLKIQYGLSTNSKSYTIFLVNYDATTYSLPMFNKEDFSSVCLTFKTAMMYCITALSSHVRGDTVRRPPS